MDQITFLLVDAILTGILIFGFQKYWEYRYDKKQFQEQLKFKMIHEKEVEALENIHKKILEFVQSLEYAHGYIHDQLFYDLKIDKHEVTKRVNDTVEKLDEFMKYLRSTSIFIPDSIKREMGIASNRAHFLHMRFIDLVVKRNPDDELDPEQVRLLTSGFTIRKSNDYSDIKNVNSVLFVICGEMALIAKRFETIYKSVAHTDDN